MLSRFYDVKSSISKALIDLKSNLHFTEVEWQKIEMLQRSLEPLKLGVEVLCRRDATLITAETTLKLFIMRKLKDENNSFSQSLITSLTKRIKERRSIQSLVLMYLQNPCEYEKELKKNPANEPFSLEKKSVIRQMIKPIMSRLLNDSEVSATSSEDEPPVNLQTAPPTLKEELERQLPSSFPAVSKKVERTM